MRFTLIEPEDLRWTSFLSRVKHDVYHKPGYVRLLGLERQMQPCACFGESAEASFLLPLLVDGLPERLGLPSDLRDARSPDGYPAPLYQGDRRVLQETLDDLMTFLADQRIIAAFVRTHPLLGVAPRDFDPIGVVVERGRTVPVFLDSAYEEILLRMRQGHRYEIRRARDGGYRVLIDRWDLYPHFVTLYRNLMARVDAAAPYRFSDDYFAGFRDAVDGSAHLAIVQNDKNVPAAGALFTHADGLVEYHLAASDPAFERDAVQKLVIDGILRWGIERGAEVVHLGGGVGAKDDSLLHFKVGFGREERVYSTVHLTPNKEALASAEAAWRDLHGGRPPEPGFFPPYRSPSPV